jgi:hypothetical protein
MRATRQARGAGPGRNHPNLALAEFRGGVRSANLVVVGDDRPEVETLAAPPHPDALKASAASARTDALEIAVPIARATVVVAVLIAGVGTLGNA